MWIAFMPPPYAGSPVKSVAPDKRPPGVLPGWRDGGATARTTRCLSAVSEYRQRLGRADGRLEA